MFYFPQQRRLIIKSLKANESRTKTFIDLVHGGYYQENRYNSPAWTPTLSYDNSLFFVSVLSDSTFSKRVVSIKGQVSRIYKTVSAYVSIASGFYLSLWMK